MEICVCFHLRWPSPKIPKIRSRGQKAARWAAKWPPTGKLKVSKVTSGYGHVGVMNCDELYLKGKKLLSRENSEWCVSLPYYFQWYTNFPNAVENLNYLNKIKIYFSPKSDLATTVGRVLKRNTFGLVTICPPLVFHSFCFPHFLKIAPADSLLAKGTVNRMGALKILALPKRGGVAPQPRFIWWIWHSVQRST